MLFEKRYGIQAIVERLGHFGRPNVSHNLATKLSLHARMNTPKLSIVDDSIHLLFLVIKMDNKGRNNGIILDQAT